VTKAAFKKDTEKKMHLFNGKKETLEKEASVVQKETDRLSLYTGRLLMRRLFSFLFCASLLFRFFFNDGFS
jgi:hypothetical protein